MSKNTASFNNFAIEEMRNRPDDVKRWANQKENLLLQSLAKEVIEAWDGIKK